MKVSTNNPQLCFVWGFKTETSLLILNPISRTIKRLCINTPQACGDQQGGRLALLSFCWTSVLSFTPAQQSPLCASLQGSPLFSAGESDLPSLPSFDVSRLRRVADARVGVEESIPLSAPSQSPASKLPWLVRAAVKKGPWLEESLRSGEQTRWCDKIREAVTCSNYSWRGQVTRGWGGLIGTYLQTGNGSNVQMLQIWQPLWRWRCIFLPIMKSAEAINSL